MPTTPVSYTHLDVYKRQDEGERAWLLRDVAPHLPAAERAEALRQALRFALAVTNEARRAWILSIVAPYLPEAERAAPLQEALRSVLTVAEEEARLMGLFELTPALVTLPAAALYDCWAAVLPLLKEQPRAAVLGIIPLLVPVIAALGGDAALSQVMAAVEESNRWWKLTGEV